MARALASFGVLYSKKVVNRLANELTYVAYPPLQASSQSTRMGFPQNHLHTSVGQAVVGIATAKLWSASYRSPITTMQLRMPRRR